MSSITFESARVTAGRSVGTKNTRRGRVFFSLEKKSSLVVLRFGRWFRRRTRGGSRSRFFRSAWRLLVEGGDNFSGEIRTVLGIKHHGDKVLAQAGLVEDQIHPVCLHALQDDVGDLLDDAFAHPHGLLLKLLFARLPKFIDLALHGFDVRDFLVPLLGFLGLGISA